jgi:hypothetical protein
MCVYVCAGVSWPDWVRSWDMRDSSGKPRGDHVVHEDNVNCLSFNPFQARGVTRGARVCTPRAIFFVPCFSPPPLQSASHSHPSPFPAPRL